MDMVERVARALCCKGASTCLSGSECVMHPMHYELAKAAIRAVLEGLEPAAFVVRHQDGKGPKELSWKGERLTNADRELGWTETPLYDLSAIKEAVK